MDNIADIYELSPMQQGMLFHTLCSPKSGVYFEQVTCALDKLNTEAFKQAWTQVVNRHPVLRTAFYWEELEKPLQVVHSKVDLPWIELNWQHLTQTEQQERLEAWLEGDRAQGFALEKAPLMRCTLIQLAAETYQFVWSHHHLLLDGWCLPILFKEVLAFTEAEEQSQDLYLPPPRPYRDYILWLQQQNLAQAEAFWRQALQGFHPTPLLDAPSNPPEYDEQQFHLSTELTAAIESLARQHHLTLNTLLQGAWALLLSRYGEKDVVFGTTVSGRPSALKGVESMVGPFINTVPVRVQCNQTELLPWLQQLQAQQVEREQYAYAPLVEIQGWSEVPRGTPLFDTLLVFENYPVSALQQGGSLEIGSVRAFERTNYPLTVIAAPAQEMLIRFIYDKRFEFGAIARMMGHLQTLLAGMVANPDTQISQLPLLTEAEHQLLSEWNATETEYPERCIHQLFEEQVQKTPDAIAVVWNQPLTYRELNARANRLAHHLQKLGVGPDVLVGLCVERSPEMIVGLLGILKAGGAYVPLDPTYPDERLEFMLADTQRSARSGSGGCVEHAQISVLLTQQRHLERFDPHQPQLCLDTDWEIAGESEENPQNQAKPDNLAYITYTSGSTGLPKGVEVLHRGVIRLLYGVNYVRLDASQRILQMAPIAFDASTFEIWGALLHGASCVLFPPEIPTPKKLGDAIKKHDITTLWLTAALFNAVVDDDPQFLGGISQLLVGGEALSVPHIRRALAALPATQIINGYGPTESTTFACTYPIPEQDHLHSIPIGRPISNTQIYLLDRHLQPVPIGVLGELYIGGAGLARGYLNRPELTAERFVPNPFQSKVNQNSKLYQTGDLARYLPDGNIEYLGRIDHQVKIRGFRIEPGEIEAVLSQHSEVRETVVMAREEPADNKRLVAYLVPHSPSLTIHSIRSFLQEKLPEYMIPSAFVLLPALPLTPNGKVDRRALPAPDAAAFELTHVAPRTPTQEILASIWAEVLGLEVGIDDNFFAVGGHSLLATQLISRVRQTFSVELPLAHLFEAPTIEKLSFAIEALRVGTQIPPIKPAPRSEPLPLSFAQQRLWFLAQLEGQSAAYSMPAAIHLRGNLQLSALEQALAAIVQRHETLRTTFKVVNGAPVQVIAPTQSLSLSVVELQSFPEPFTQVERFATAEAQRPFDLTQGLVRVVLLHLGESHVLLVNMHHIVSDGWSVGIFIRELSVLYTAYCQGSPSPLPALPIQYADFAVWQRRWLSGEVLAQQLHYWKQHLAGAPLLLELPTDRPRPPVQSFRGGTVPLQLDQELTKQLKTLSQQSGATLFMTLLAAFAVLLSRYSNQEDLVIGSPIANRNRHEIEPLIGFFVNTLALRIVLEDNPSFCELLEQVRSCALDAYAHQDLPFERLVEEMQPQRDLDRNPLVQVVFALQNAPLGDWSLPDLSLEPLEFDTRAVRFDLECHLWEFPEGLSGYFVYNTDLFDASTIARIASNFQTLLTAIVANPQQRVFLLPLLTNEQHQILAAWNDTKAEYPQQCIHELFEAQVERSPDAVAVVCADQQLSYRELNQQANQLAHTLQIVGVGPEVLVGICAERSLDLVVGLLGILKAGGAYLPLDPTYPQARLSYLLQDSQVSVLLTQQKLISQLPPHQAQIVCLDDWRGKEEGGRENREHTELASSPVTCHLKPDTSPPAAENLAYVIYTSGSTGNPKGVLVTHQGLLNLVIWHQRAFAVTSSDRATQLARTAFDASAWEIWSTLCAGARLYLAEEHLGSPLQLQQWLVSKEITLSFLPTPLAEELLALEWSEDVALRTMLTGGDRLHQYPSPTLPFQVINNYGPTENTVVTTSGLVSPQGRGLPPIGRPIDNTQVYILDKYLQPVPIGVPGELHISGAGLARGYLNRPELTAEKFIPNPFEEGKQGDRETGGRGDGETREKNISFNLPVQTRDLASRHPMPKLYKTGDLARYLPNGDIEYLGRIDQQVNLRGFRIEPGEIEAVLLEHSTVQEVAVIVREDQLGQQLVAYVVPNLSDLDQQWQTEHLSYWQTLYEQTYSQSSHQDPTFNIVGWNSSYTNLPIPEAQMREWVDYTVERILHQQPQRVLEIGCGTGLLLSRIAPHCTQYWGTDYSAAAIRYVQQLQDVPGLEHVTLLQRMADDFEGITEAFDAVILNSVVQYFPSIDYLLRVLAKSVKVVQPGGFIYVGDVRSLPLLEAYHTSVELEQAPDSLSVEELQQRIEQRVAQEEELVIDPAFFVALQQQFPQINRVHIQPKRGRDRNELTRFRYDVILHVASLAASVVPEWMDWHQGLTLNAVRQRLSDEPDIFGIKGVPNARLSGVLRLGDLLECATVGELRAAQESETGVDPEDWWSLASESYTVTISLSDRGAGFYDVIFETCLPSTKPILPIAVDIPSLKPWRTYANNPLQGKLSQLSPQWRGFLQQTLPDYMVPSTFVILESLPLTPNGKIDKLALPAPASKVGVAAPRTPTEEALAAIWGEVLGRQVGIYDNFFELGGHSLLAVRLVAQIEQRFGKNLPLATLFQNPTIEQLAACLRQPSSSSWSPLVPIQSGGTQRPFFCVPGAGGNVLYLYDLARYLGSDQPVYGLQSLGLDGSEPYTDIKDIATTYTQAIQIAQPQGPYLLGGHSFGAHVAFEIAQQLQRQGHEVARLVILDAPAPTANRQPIGLDWDNATWLTQIAKVAERLVGKNLGITYEFLQSLEPDEQLNTFKQQLQRVNLLPPEAGITLRGLVQVYKANCQATYELPQAPAPTRIILFRAVEVEAAGEASLEDPTWGWSQFASKPVELYTVSGDHLTMLTKPHVQVLAQQLKTCLRDFDSMQ